ncbi:hypothetical protein [Bacillus weihaiensis]|uniref:hypothetical protein n=1 Tax=Bacillus weihaiensis TaxID=1547283 RepID=UPI0023530E83|nr:hypothetical protein [Bacillus weihaiensis]
MEQHKPISITFLIGGGASVSLIFLTGEMVIRYGALVGLSIVSAFIIICAIFIPFIKKQEVRHSWFSRIIHFFYFFEILVIHLFIASTILESVFHFHILIAIITSLSLTLFFVFLSRYSSHIPSIFKIMNVTLLFSLAIFLTNYIYLQEGLETVYHNLLHYHPEVLHTDYENQHLVYWVTIGVIFTKCYIQLPIYEPFSKSIVGNGISRLLVGGIIYITLILSFSTMTIVAITQNLPSDNLNELLILLIKEKSESFIFLPIMIIFYFLTLITNAIKYNEYKEAYGRPKKLTLLLLGITNMVVVYFLFDFQISFLMTYLYSSLFLFILILLKACISLIYKISNNS